jgi:hypothetical protein
MRNKQALTILALLLVSAFCIQGCHKDLESSPTLSPLATFESVLPTPVVEPSLPQPSPGLAVIGGRIIDLRTQRAPLEGVVYLGKIVRMDNGQPVTRLDRETAPSAVPMESGWFVFQDVAPDEYGLVFYMPELSFLVDDPQGEGSLIFTVVPDQVLDLGKIEVSTP